MKKNAKTPHIDKYFNISHLKMAALITSAVYFYQTIVNSYNYTSYESCIVQPGLVCLRNTSPF